jgi:hypothetical protein
LKDQIAFNFSCPTRMTLEPEDEGTVTIDTLSVLQAGSEDSKLAATGLSF